MIKFTYRAKERNGNITTGDIEANSLAEARSALRQKGLFLLQIGVDQGVAAQRPGFSLRNRIKKSDVVMMLSQITIMSQSGVDLSEALKSVATQCPNPALQTVMHRVSEDIEGGSTFASALRKHPHVFDEMFVAGIAAGEQSGAITEVLERLTNLLRSDMRMRQTVISTLMYPLVLCAVTVVVLIVLFFFILPQFAKVFADLEKAPPPFTQIMLSTGEFVRGNFFLLGGLLIALAAVTYSLRNAEFVRNAWDYASLNFTFAKKATRSLSTGRTFRLLGTMLSSGVPLVDSIRLCRSASGNSLFRSMYERLESEVLRGEGLGPTLLSSSFLPSGAAHMVATAEKTGKLGDVLKMVGEYFEDQGERQLRDVVKLLEPVVIVFLGVVVAGVAFSVILPLLDVSSMPQ
ncbi:Type II secretion system protein F [Novipirellula galeiformis]|uniref:Type II secretion system protein F n=1 Tax=Novipirellula galeiformis TaxID=2528004 RepID=A0A5C6CA16_9BACT|nr:type II secretion system F family protein [Novipirellula galeiformis]TWU20982.1 Type II secretion system protein F [Novipirellula galeiformis]